MTRYGSQLGANKGYNPKKKGRVSHHPLIAFVGELRMVANFWLRSGKSSSANNFVNFLAETISFFKDKKVYFYIESLVYSDIRIRHLEHNLKSLR